jgi:hypothetical protein
MDDYDVVADALQKHRDRLWGMINRNMNSEYVTLNIMDDIRFYQIEKLDAAIAAHKNKKEWVGLTDEEYEEMAEQYVTNCYFDTLEYAKNIEVKLKEKNSD